MSEQATNDGSNFRAVIEDNFETTGPYIGRTKNTELAVTMAQNELKGHVQKGHFERVAAMQVHDVVKEKYHQDLVDKQQKGADDAAKANRGALLMRDADYVAANDAVNNAPVPVSEDLFQAKITAARAVKGGYNRLQADKAAYEAQLLAKARDQAVNQHNAG